MLTNAISAHDVIDVTVKLTRPRRDVTKSLLNGDVIDCDVAGEVGATSRFDDDLSCKKKTVKS